MKPASHHSLLWGFLSLADDESPGLYGFLHVIVHSAKGFKQSASKYPEHQPKGGLLFILYRRSLWAHCMGPSSAHLLCSALLCPGRGPASCLEPWGVHPKTRKQLLFMGIVPAICFQGLSFPNPPPPPGVQNPGLQPPICQL